LFFNALAAATLIVLAFRPGDLFTASFQLSFGILLGLMVLCRRIEAVVLRRDKDAEALSEPAGATARFWRRALRPTISLSISAAAISLPLVAFPFHMAAWISPVTTVILTLPMALLLASGFILMAFGWAPTWIADLLAVPVDSLARLIGWIVRMFAHVPGGHCYVADLPWVWIVVVYGLLAAWIWRERLGISRHRLAIAALAAAAAFLWTTGRRPPENVRATFLAVGSGNANIVELPNGRTLLYDAGSALSYVRAGEGTIAPALWSRGIERLDAVFISHPHFDHFKDILPIVKWFGVRRVFVPPTFTRRRLRIDKMVVTALIEGGVRVEFFSGGDRLAGTGDVEVSGLWPRGPASQTREINDGSLVLGIQDGGRRLLLTGDIEAPAIAALLAAEPDIRADAMLWPHHGGDADADAVQRLAEVAGAKVLVISAGAARAVPPPVPFTYLRTAEDGAVAVMLEADGPAVETFAGGR
jgi:competence protein ComEC